MKAIIILTEEFSQEEVVISRLADVIREHTNNGYLEIAALSTKDIAQAIAKDKLEEKQQIDRPIADLIEKYCKTVIEHVGSPALCSAKTFSAAYAASLIQFPDIHNKEALKAIVKYGGLKPFQDILKNYGLEMIRGVILDLNGIKLINF